MQTGELRWDVDEEIIDYKDPYHDSMEWMLQFPEVLDDEARFIGFDVIIGNPPYINMQKLGKMSKFYQRLPGRIPNQKRYETYNSKGDILTLFFELGLMLVREGGLVSYITSNSWMRTEFGENTRMYLSKKSNPLLLADFVGFQVFENVTVETNIMILSKGENQQKTLAVNINKDDYKTLDSYLKDNLIECDFNTSDFWYILQPQDQRIRNQVMKVGKQLKDKAWNLLVRRGIPTGNNDAFLINSEQRNKILENCSTEREIELTDRLIQKVIKGEDVRRYGYNWNDLYLITTFPSRKHEILLYPSVQKHLTTFEEDKLRTHGYEWIADDEKFGDIALYDVGPSEFVNLIRYAKYVCTDSFHGSVFSIIYHKQFISFNRYKEGANSRNSRLDTLFANIGVSRKYRSDLLSEIEKKIEWGEVDKRLEELRLSDSALYKLAGNAVSVNVVYAILSYLSETFNWR